MVTITDWTQIELDQARETIRRMEQREIDAYQQHRERVRQEIEQSHREANTWPEALEKQAFLLGRETTRNEDQDNPLDTFFTDGSAACHRAIEIWQEIEERESERIADLQRQITEILNSIRGETADRLREESDRIGWQQIATDLDTVEDLNDWLNW